MTAVLLLNLATLVVMLVSSIIHRRQHLRVIEYVNSESSRLGSQFEALAAKIRKINELLGPTAAIDVSHKGHDSGWLILLCKVNGQDHVLLQELRRDMSMHDYQRLVETLSHDCAHVAFIDTPYRESFLLSEDKLFRRSGR